MHSATRTATGDSADISLNHESLISVDACQVLGTNTTTDPTVSAREDTDLENHKRQSERERARERARDKETERQRDMAAALATAAAAATANVDITRLVQGPNPDGLFRVELDMPRPIAEQLRRLKYDELGAGRIRHRTPWGTKEEAQCQADSLMAGLVFRA